MSTDTPAVGSGAGRPVPDRVASENVFSFTQILNVFWRRRWTILLITVLGVVAGLAYSFLTRPLYRATAQVRPGIVSYTDYGAPVREWHLKDIVRWFRTELYWSDMQAQPAFDSYKRAPVVTAEFIPQGPQYVEGGDVIMLENLARDPAEAKLILDQAIAAFNAQAASDSLGSTLHLTRGGARIRIAMFEGDQSKLLGERALLEHSIRMKQRELELIALEREQIAADVAALEKMNDARQRIVDAAHSEITTARRRLVGAEAALARYLRTESGDPSPAGEPQDLAASIEQIESPAAVARAGELLLTVNEMSRHILDVQVMADTLQIGIQRTMHEIETLRTERDLALRMRAVDADREIGDFEIQIEHDLPYQHQQLQQNINSEHVRLGLLSPLETIGAISVTNKPVRPRKLRATTILTVLAFLAALFFVLAVEYFSRNKHAITASIRR